MMTGFRGLKRVFSEGMFRKLALLFCIAGAGASFLGHLFINRWTTGRILAPISVNIELQKEYADSISIEANDGRYFIFEPTYYAHNELDTVVMCTVISDKTFIQELYLRIPAEKQRAVLEAINTVSVFVGNKLFYFTGSEIESPQSTNTGEYALFPLNVQYKPSMIKPYRNWYGDFHFFLRAVCECITSPAKYLLVWLFVLLICIFFRAEMTAFSKRFTLGRKIGGSPRMAETALLLCILVFGFLLRIDGYHRYAIRSDEYYSLFIASDPAKPFISTFGDPGNPPLYFMLLRVWLRIFGTTVDAGKMLSIIIGVLSIAAVYGFVRTFAGKAAAALAAVFMAFSSYLIEFSQMARTYMLTAFLAVLCAWLFLRFLRREKTTDLVLYCFCGILLVNSHYYGALLIAVVFLCYLWRGLEEHTLCFRKTAAFFLGNCVIALSLLPFFWITAYRKALIDPVFNRNKGRPDVGICLLVFAIAVLLIIYRVWLKKFFAKTWEKQRLVLFDLSLLIPALIIAGAFGVSVFIPFLEMRYFTICLPFIIIFTALLCDFLWNEKPLRYTGAVLAFAFLSYLYQAEGRIDLSCWTETGRAFIAKDAARYPGFSYAILGRDKLKDLEADNAALLVIIIGDDTNVICKIADK